MFFGMQLGRFKVWVRLHFVWWGIAGENLLSPSLVATFPWFGPSIVVFTPCPVHIFYPCPTTRRAVSREA